MRHFSPTLLVIAFLVEALVLGAAVKNTLVATDRLRHGVEGVDQQPAQAFLLVVLGDRNVLDVPARAEIVDASFQTLDREKARGKQGGEAPPYTARARRQPNTM